MSDVDSLEHDLDWTRGELREAEKKVAALKAKYSDQLERLKKARAAEEAWRTSWTFPCGCVQSRGKSMLKRCAEGERLNRALNDAVDALGRGGEIYNLPEYDAYFSHLKGRED
jgi:hypothetical protein